MAVKQTAGRDALGEFAPKFAELNDDVLFGEVWSREEELSLRDRSLVTVVSLIAMGLTDNSFRYHLESAKRTASRRQKWQRSSPTPLSMWAGRKHGQRSAWQRRSMRHEGTGTVLFLRRQHTPCCKSWFSRRQAPICARSRPSLRIPAAITQS